VTKGKEVAPTFAWEGLTLRDCMKVLMNSWLRQYVARRLVKRKRRNLPADPLADPRLVSYYPPSPVGGRTVVVPAQSGRAFNAFALDANSYHPWFLAVSVAEVGDRAVIRKILKAYYSLVQPKSLHDWLDVPEDACPALAELPVYAWMMLPLSTMNPRQFLKRVEDAHLQENRRYGLNEGVSAGAKAFGPLSEDKLRVEVDRIATLATSIRRRGFQQEQTDVLKAMFLLSDGEWRWLAVNAMHRVPVAAGLGIDHLPVQVVAVVRRDEVDIWPQVTTGLYDRDTALGVFDRLFEGRAPKCAASWLNWVDRLRSESVWEI